MLRIVLVAVLYTVIQPSVTHSGPISRFQLSSQHHEIHEDNKEFPTEQQQQSPEQGPATRLKRSDLLSRIVRDASVHKKRRKYPLPTLRDKHMSEVKRGLEIGVQLNFTRTPVPATKQEKLFQEALQQVLKEEEAIGQFEEVQGYPVAKALRRILKPAYECDAWDPSYRICILERNIGDTVTFYLSTGSLRSSQKAHVTWKKEFHTRNSKSRSELVIDPENSHENIIIGLMGYELRVSPITETDVGFNLFSATLVADDTSPLSKLFYMIRVVPIDLGFVYVGETIEINLNSFVRLPAASMSFKWYMEKDGEHGTLPSNMKVSVSGSSIKVSELRQSQEGVLACTVYTNRNFLATKKRFLIKDLVKNSDVLKSAPNHDITFKEAVESVKHKVQAKRFKREENRGEFLQDDSVAVTEVSTSSSAVSDITRYDQDYNLALDIGQEGKAAGGNEPAPAGEMEDINSAAQGGQQSIPNDDNPVDFQEPLNPAQPEDRLPNSNYQPAPLASDQYLPPPNTKPEQNGANQKSSNGANMPSRGNANYPTKGSPSDVILNIERNPVRKRDSAEEVIAKTISYCSSDSDCSGDAACIQVNAKVPGFCKCLPGFNGVGIFCREGAWMNIDKFQLDE